MAGNSDNNNDEYEKVCIVCSRPESRAGKIISMPGGLMVCTDCLQKVMDTMSSNPYINSVTEMMKDGSIPAEYADKLKELTADAKKPDESTQTVPAAVSGSADESAEDEPDEGQADDGEGEDGGEGEPRQGGEPDLTTIFGIPGLNIINLSGIRPGSREIGRRQQPKKKKNEPRREFDRSVIPAPHIIKSMLDEYIVGQDQAKKAVSVAVYNHYKRVCSDNADGIEIEKSNMLLLGPTGCGKTYLVRTLARLLDVPLAIADATSLTEAGYIGDDIESVVSKLLAAADNDVEKAETGIIYIDEIDKIAKKKNTTSRDVSGESVQQELLKMLEGSEVEVPVGSGSKSAMVPMATVNTTNILFICGGAFPELEDIIKERLTQKSGIGFESELKDRFDNEKDILCKVTTEDLRKFGMIPEFLGRMPVVVTLKALDKDSMVKILKEPKNAITKQYKKLLMMDEVQLEFEDGALEAVAEKAMKRDTGARALRAVLEEYMQDIMYEIPKDDNIGRVIITRDYIEGTGGPRIEMRGAYEIEMKEE